MDRKRSVQDHQREVDDEDKQHKSAENLPGSATSSILQCDGDITGELAAVSHGVREEQECPLAPAVEFVQIDQQEDVQNEEGEIESSDKRP